MWICGLGSRIYGGNGTAWIYTGTQIRDDDRWFDDLGVSAVEGLRVVIAVRYHALMSSLALRILAFRSHIPFLAAYLVFIWFESWREKSRHFWEVIVCYSN